MAKEKPDAQMADQARWGREAACKNYPAVMFDTIKIVQRRPGTGRKVRSTLITGDVERARAICEGCPVKMNCLQHALRFKVPDGVWGGMVIEEREALDGQPRTVAA